MTTPTTRTPVRLARGSTTNLSNSVSDIQEGEIVWDSTTSKLKVKVSSSLVETGATADASKANLASPTFTGTPAAPTASVSTNTTQVATTAFVVAEIADEVGTTVQAQSADLASLSSCQSGGASALAALTSSEIGVLDGATVTTTELNLLDGVTASTTEINYVDGVTSNVQTQLDAKQASDADLTSLSSCQTGAASAIALLTATEVGVLDGVTATTAEVNILDGVTSTTAELNLLDGVTSTTTELNLLDGVTATTAELNTLDGVSAGTVSASKALITDGNKDLTGLRNLYITGDLSVQGSSTVVDTVTMEAANAIKFEGLTANEYETVLTIIDPTADHTIKIPNQSGCIPVLAADSSTQVTSTPAELNILDGVTATATELNLLDGVTATTAELNYSDGVTSNIQTQLDAKQTTDADLTALSSCQTGAATALALLTATEVEVLDGVTATTAEVNILDGVTSTATELNLLDGVTATTAELNYSDGVTSNIQTQLNAKGAGDAVLASDQTWTGAQRGTITALTDAATVAVDFSSSNNFSLTLAGNRTLGQPSNQVAGQSGSIFITQDGTGSRTLAYHADWKWAGGTAPTLSTTAAAVDRIDYALAASNKIHAVVTLDVK